MEVDIKVLITYMETLVLFSAVITMVLVLGMAIIADLLDKILRELKE